MNLELLTQCFLLVSCSIYKRLAGRWYYGVKKISPKIDLMYAVINCALGFNFIIEDLKSRYQKCIK